jgi:actin-related protein 6
MAGQRKQKPAPSPRPTNTLVVDNGGNTIKAGLVRGFDIPEPSVIPNCIARDRARKTYVASELDKCRDLGEVQFRRPVEKGSVVSWDAQRAIWDAELIGPASRLKCDPSETRLVLGEAPNSLPALQLNCDQMVFEEYGFASYFRGLCETHYYFPGLSFSCLTSPSTGLQRLPRCPKPLPNTTRRRSSCQLAC